MMRKQLLRSDTRGIGAAEFALIAPVLISFVIGISQVGKLFYANADMKNAMASGARVASVWPVPNDNAIIAAVKARLARTSGAGIANVTIPTRAVDAKGNAYLDIKMDYNVPLDFIFFNIGPVKLEDTRRVYVQMAGVRSAANDTAGCTSNCGGTEDPPADPDPTPDDPTSDPDPDPTPDDPTPDDPTPEPDPTPPGDKDKDKDKGHDHGKCNKNC